MKYLASILTAIGAVAATVGTMGCWFWVADEPEMPRSLIEK